MAEILEFKRPANDSDAVVDVQDAVVDVQGAIEVPVPEGRGRRFAKRFAGIEFAAAFKWVARGTSDGLLHLVRYVLFFVLLWVRKPVQFVLGLIAFPAMVALPIVYFGQSPSPEKNTMLWAVVIFGLGAVAISWAYDALLLKLSPEPMVLA